MGHLAFLRRYALKKAAVGAQNSRRAKDGAGPTAEADGDGANHNIGKERCINDILFRGRE